MSNNTRAVSHRWLQHLWNDAQRMKDEAHETANHDLYTFAVNVKASIILMIDPSEFDREDLPNQTPLPE